MATIENHVCYIIKGANSNFYFNPYPSCDIMNYLYIIKSKHVYIIYV